MRVTVDRSRCTALGICEAISEDHFLLDDDGVLEVVRPEVDEPDDVATAERAVANCPNGALSLVAD